MQTAPPMPPKGPKPTLRGVSHLLGAACTLPAAFFLKAQLQEPTPTWPVTLYLSGLFLLLGVSALYHVPMWSPAVRANLRRLDRSMIYIFVAGTYTPLVIQLGETVPQWILPVTWAAALMGVALAIFVSGAPRWLTALTYVLLGWGAAFLMPAIHHQYGARIFWFITGGGLLYTLGAVVYAFKWPNPFPAVYGYHEIFHLLVLLAAALHYTAILKVLTCRDNPSPCRGNPKIAPEGGQRPNHTSLFPRILR